MLLTKISNKIRVLIVDDSNFRRQTIRAMLQANPDIKVVGEAKNGAEAVELTQRLHPSVITMDFRMPQMSGEEAIKRIMAKMPTPVIVVSAFVKNNTDFTFKCLELGALDFVPLMYDTNKMAAELVKKVKMASKVKVMRHIRHEYLAKSVRPERSSSSVSTKVVAIATSTGGPVALESIIPYFDKKIPFGIVVVQHIAAHFSFELAKWLDEKSEITVREAQDEDRIVPGVALVAPGGRHLEVTKGGIVRLAEEPKLTYMPSADVMLESVANVYGPQALAVIMTGMGSDGAKGMLAIRDAGGQTIAQDQATSVVFGMNKSAIDNGSIDRVVPLNRITNTILDMA